MGIILSRFREKKTTIEILEDLDSKIKEIQEYGQNTEQKHKKIVGTLVIYSVVLYITTAFIFYFYFFPASLYDQIFYITPLLIFPIIILFTKKMVSWYYKRKISQNQEKLATMQREKNNILDEVTETETYKKAKEILLRFAPDQLKMTSTSATVPQNVEELRQPDVSRTIIFSSPGIGEIRRRTPNQSFNVLKDINAQTLSVDGTPNKTPQSNTPIQTGSKRFNNTPMCYRSPEYTLARPILPHHRSNFDRLIDYLVGDGPSNRYALICRQCECHNGMALKEEFEYLGFRCCYCNFWNPPRKQKPGVQRIKDVFSPTSGILANDSSDKNTKTSKHSEIEASCLSDTDSDIEVVERPAEISENQENIDDDYTDSNINKKGMQNSEEKKSNEEMEVEN
ncbi:endoplasmic reticulum junction formation protein lunapark-B isoform X1 [Vespa velutina]|uniref:endoplasmic reticulum junction formation protein lunapark-B isoform X1 n=1 Tax=Vespa velutina TaxID=202808 RepID=UPI001FB33559|nr:endoplasmic reticulum junction formation protein lunapark-B isoform X1 [Vespa velutina]XP_047346539.1 endoplasmic reticulum junction formation protein lunapark-B isoform X1 [Vespa velutina]XP_047346540.1 endoplasmic reticulum junction formation protein lunapark-B isoform X1 [Vespa velutina]